MGSSRSSRAPNQLEGSLFDVDSDQEMFIHLDMISGVADRSRKGRTLYSQVAEQIEAFALAGPLGEETMTRRSRELANSLASAVARSEEPSQISNVPDFSGASPAGAPL